MKSGFLSVMSVLLSTMILLGCGSSGTGKQTEPFELEGTWLYSGAANFGERLEFSSSSMVETDPAGGWSGTWSINEYDNALDHVQVVLESKTGTFPSAVGLIDYVSYVLNGDLLTLYWSKTGYPQASGGTEGVDCLVYTKQK